MKKLLYCFLSLAFVLLVVSCSCSRKPQTFMVTFDSQGGSLVESQTVEKGKTATKPTDPTRMGFDFDGWFLDLNNTSDGSFSFDTKIEKDTTLYAKWNTVVEENIVGIEITKQPNKLVYIEGENFDPTGMIVVGHLDDGTTKEITNYTYMQDFDLPLNLTSFPITYGTFEAYVSITVVEKEILSVEIESLPTKTAYKCYEYFNPEGLKLKVTYNNGKNAIVEDNISYSREIIGNVTSTEVTYTERGTSYKVTVPLTVSVVPYYGIPSTKESVFVSAGDFSSDSDFPSDGTLVSQANINKSKVFGDLEFVNSASRYMQYQMNNPSGEVYSETHFGHTFTGIIKLGGATSPDGRFIKVNPTENGRLYFWASSSANAVLALYQTYTETSTEEDIIQTIQLTNTITEYSIPVYAGENFVITGAANAFFRGVALVYSPTYYEVTDLTIATEGTKVFAEGQQFNTEGLAVTVSLTNGATYPLLPEEYVVTGPDMSQVGSSVVTITYQNLLTKTYQVSIEAINAIEVKHLPTQTQYYNGQDLDPTGLIVVAKTASGIEYEITGYTISKTENLQAGDSITITYKTLSCPLAITISENPISSIKETHRPTKTDYYSGEQFETDGLEISIVWTDGLREEKLENLNDVTFDRGQILPNDDKVKATYHSEYGDFELDIQITVTNADWYLKDDTTYYDAVTIVTAAEVDSPVTDGKTGKIESMDTTIGDVRFYCESSTAFQYDKWTTTYNLEGHVYTGQFRSGATSATRYIQITPKADGVLTIWGLSATGTVLYLLNQLTEPSAEDPNTYVDKCDTFSGTSTAVKITFNLEAEQTYYLWIANSTNFYFRAFNICYGKVNTRVTGLQLETESVQQEFSVNDAFNYDHLVVKVQCADGKSYVLLPEEYEVIAPDMTEAGSKDVVVKFKDYTQNAYQIQIN